MPTITREILEQAGVEFEGSLIKYGDLRWIETEKFYGYLLCIGGADKTPYSVASVEDVDKLILCLEYLKQQRLNNG